MRARKPKNYKIFDNYSYFIPGVAEMFIVLMWLLVGALLGNVVTLLFAAFGGQEVAQEYGMIVAYPIMFIPAMMYASVKSRNSCLTKRGIKLDSNNFGKTGGLLCAILAAISTLSLAFCSDAVNSLLPPIPAWLEETLKGLTTGKFWINFLCVSIFAPFFEEWLCRGTILRGLLGKGMKPVWAIAISALFFALIHANPWQAVPAFMLGCLFGYVYWRTGSLKLTMLMHCVNNTFALVCSRIDSLSDMENWMEVLPGMQYWILFAASVLLIILIVRVFARIPLKDSKSGCDTVPPLFEQ